MEAWFFLVFISAYLVYAVKDIGVLLKPLGHISVTSLNQNIKRAKSVKRFFRLTQKPLFLFSNANAKQ